MTAAGVQTTDAAAYLPPPSSASTPDAKGAGTAGKQGAGSQAAGTPGEPSDFQSELAREQTATQDVKTADQSGPVQTGPTQTATGQAGSTQTGSTGLIQTGSTPVSSRKTDSGKTDKKRNVLPDDAKPAAVTPLPVAEPQKQILPFSLALPQPPENTKPEESAKPSENATPDEISQTTVRQPAQLLSPSLDGIAQLPELRQPVVLKQSMKVRQSSVEALPTTDLGKGLVQTLAPVAAVTDMPAGQGDGSADPSSQDPTAPPKPGESPESQPVSLAGFKMPATPMEPVASTVRETIDSAASSPSALAFAARLAAVPQKPGQPAATNPIQPPSASSSQTGTQIPVRYAATAQIIPSAALDTQQDEPKKDPGDSGGRFARPDARTDMVLPRFEASSEPAAASAAPQQSAPTARPESIIEPPPTPPTSSHDIRVRVPDNNGGSTQVRFVESGGEVRVSVRTADESLAQNLRTHLNDLTQRLSDGGTAAEIWKPASNPSSSSQNDQHQQSQQDGRGANGQGYHGQGGQQDRQQKRPAWLEEMESSLHGGQN